MVNITTVTKNTNVTQTKQYTDKFDKNKYASVVIQDLSALVSGDQ